MGHRHAQVQRARSCAAPLPLLLFCTNTRRTALPHRHWRCFLLFIFFLLSILFFLFFFLPLLLFYLFLIQAPVIFLGVCPHSQDYSLSLALFQSLVLLQKSLQRTPNGRQTDINIMYLSGLNLTVHMAEAMTTRQPQF